MQLQFGSMVTKPILWCTGDSIHGHTRDICKSILADTIYFMELLNEHGRNGFFSTIFVIDGNLNLIGKCLVPEILHG